MVIGFLEVPQAGPDFRVLTPLFSSFIWLHPYASILVIVQQGLSWAAEGWQGIEVMENKGTGSGSLDRKAAPFLQTWEQVS